MGPVFVPVRSNTRGCMTRNLFTCDPKAREQERKTERKVHTKMILIIQYQNQLQNSNVNSSTLPSHLGCSHFKAKKKDNKKGTKHEQKTQHDEQETVGP